MGDTLLSLDTVGRHLYLPQLGMPDFQLPKEGLTLLRHGWGGKGGKGSRRRAGRGK